MDLMPRPLAFPPGQLNGLSERLLTSHHANNYSGAVKRLNAIRAQLAALDFASAPGFQLNGLKREELVATNSMLLHELYFASLGGDGQTMVPAMTLALDANFGSVDRWRAEFVAMGKALGGGSGWVLLTFLPRDGTLVNQWAADHTRRRSPAAFRSSRSTCTSTRITWTSAPRPAPTSMRSWPTSTGRRSTSDTSSPSTARASPSRASQDDAGRARRCSTFGAPECSRRPRP